MSTVFKLQSDNLFIRSWPGDANNIHVYEHKGDPTGFGMIYADGLRWGTSVAVDASADAPFKELEVLGVKIGGTELKELVKDLTFVNKSGQTFHFLVNRQGLCLLYLSGQSVTWMRNNDRFGWSKYGVKPRKRWIWSVCDMSNGDVLVDRKDHDHAESLKEMIEEKEKEVASLKASLRTLIAEN